MYAAEGVSRHLHKQRTCGIFKVTEYRDCTKCMDVSSACAAGSDAHADTQAVSYGVNIVVRVLLTELFRLVRVLLRDRIPCHIVPPPSLPAVAHGVEVRRQACVRAEC